MSKYTITIKNLIDNNFDFKMTEYPIFDENYRNVLNQKILNHYYENEIGFETAPLFRFYLNNKLNEIMPYYNELYKIQKKIIDDNLLLNNVNLREELQGKNDKIDKTNIENNTSTNTENNTSTNTENNTSTNTESNSNSTNNGSSNNKQLFQDTPQGQISSTDIDNQTWATNLTLNKNETNNNITDTSKSNGTSNNTINSTTNNNINSTTNNNINNTLNSNSTNSYIKTIIGNNGNKFNIDILNDIQNKMINIDMLIINELYDLFMQIF